MKMIVIHQTEVEQLTVTRDPGDVGEQCSNTWQPLDSKLEPVQVVVVMMMVLVVLVKPRVETMLMVKGWDILQEMNIYQ